MRAGKVTRNLDPSTSEKAARQRAFVVVVDGFDPYIVLDVSAAKARYAAFRSLREAGWTDYSFPDIRVRRSPEHDPLSPEELCGRSA